MKKIGIMTGLASALVLLAATLGTSPATATDGGTHAVEERQDPETSDREDLRIVPASEVCMVNDRFFGVAQIPVPVGQQTYYGCCEGCKQRLAEEEAVRFATDPVTGERVDKATALIATGADGSVLYFAGEESLETYRGAGS